MQKPFDPTTAVMQSCGIGIRNNTVVRLVDKNRNVMEVPTDTSTFAALAAAGAKVYNEREEYRVKARK